LSDLPIGYEDVTAAARRIRGHVHRTPVLTSTHVNDVAGISLFFKCENLQRAGAFKARGAFNKLLSLKESERSRGVVAFSSGNHAQAVALAAGSLGIDAKIVMPADAPRAKIEATRGYGATIVVYDRQSEDRERIAGELAENEGRILVPPYDDPWIMAGQGTAALELVEEAPELEAIVVPVGGGGLLAGTATALEGADTRILAFGAEPENADDTARSLEKGERVRIDPPDTIADGARVEIPGEKTFPVLLELAEAVVRVPDAALVLAMRLLLTRMKILVEPTGVLGAAAALEGLLPEGLERVGVVLSGGNVDPATLARLLTGD
jgi:threonine dehydratase